MSNALAMASNITVTAGRCQWYISACLGPRFYRVERACFTTSRVLQLPCRETFAPRSPLSWQLACRTSRGNQKNTNAFSTTTATSVRAHSKLQPDKGAKPNPSLSKASAIIPEQDLLPGQPFSSKRIREIYGENSKVDTDLGNFILASIHLRRRRGTLVELGVRPYNKKRAWTEESGNKALAWLREHHPLDEGLAAAEFAENEARRIEEDINIKKALRWGLIKPREGAEEIKSQKREKTEPLTKSEEIYGKSFLQEMREANEKRHKKELKRLLKEEEAIKEEERMRHIKKYVKRAELEGKTVKDLVPSGDIKDVVVPVQFRGNDLSVYEKKGTILHSPEPPKMSRFERLWRSTLVTIATLAGCAFFAYIYRPPSTEERLFPGTTPAAATCLGIIALNFAVFVAWKWPPFWRTLNMYFHLTPGYPHAMSILGNTVSHQQLFHLSANMLWLYLVGTHLHDLIGRGNFLALYIGSSALSSWCSLTFHVARNMLITGTLGASGAVACIISAYLYLQENFGTWQMPFSKAEVDINGHSLLAAFIGMELLAVAVILLGRAKYRLDHAAHLGGMVSGIAGARILQSRAQIDLPAAREGRQTLLDGEEQKDSNSGQAAGA